MYRLQLWLKIDVLSKEKKGGFDIICLFIYLLFIHSFIYLFIFTRKRLTLILFLFSTSQFSFLLLLKALVKLGNAVENTSVSQSYHVRSKMLQIQIDLLGRTKMFI